MKRFFLVVIFSAVCVTPALCQTAEQKKATIAFVQKLQHTGGGFLLGESDNKATGGSLRATTAALRALKYFGGEPKDRPGCIRFVQSCFDEKTGGFGDHPGELPSVNSTSAGLMALVALDQPGDNCKEAALRYLNEKVKTFEDIRIAAAALETVQAKSPQAAVWLEQIARMRNSDGTYGKGDGVARATGGAIVAVLRLGGKAENADKTVQALRAGQRQDGGFGREGSADADLESSYRVMRAFVMLKKKPSVRDCRGFVELCRNRDGGYAIVPGQPSSVSATYFASTILHWLEEMDHWKD
jgi:prenyltransferase beta subunit